MGSLSFLLPEPLPAAASTLLPGACFAAPVGGSGSADQAPIPTKIEITPGKLTASRMVSESGVLMAPWPIGPFGPLVTSTTTLRETPEPYRLLTELARGKLNQVRTQSAEWAGIGLHHSPGFEDSLAEATRIFGKALAAPTPAEADALASRVLEQSHVLADVLVRDFIEQMFDTRHHEEGPLDSRLAARLRGPADAEYARAFNAAQLAIDWRQIEPDESRYDWTVPDAVVAMAKAADLPLTAGPVIDLCPGMLPPWVTGWEGDFPTLAAFMCDFLETVVTRYKGDVRRWVICGGFNHADALGLDDDDRMRLAFRLFEAAAQIDPGLELVLSVAQPWGDYLADESHTISPLTFPDDLMRAGLRLSGLEVEIRAGAAPRGSPPRDLLDTSRVINLFGVLQLPLEIVLSLPSSNQPDSEASAHGQSVWQPGIRTLTPEGQAEWGASFAALALCIPHVRAVTWDHWSDAHPHLTPTGGLLDASGQPKPLLARLRTLRSAHLR